MSRRPEIVLKIWGRKNSINVQKVMWTVAELGLAHERIDAGMSFGQVGEPWFQALNPNRKVPVIDDDGVVVWESNVIVRYLTAKHAQAGLMPAGLAGRAQVETWMDWQQTTVMLGLGPLFLGLIRTPPEQRDRKAMDAAADMVAAGMRILDARLQDRDHVIGERLSAADIPLGCATYRWYALPIQRPELPNLRRWYERLAARPAFAEHVMLPLS